MNDEFDEMTGGSGDAEFAPDEPSDDIFEEADDEYIETAEDEPSVPDLEAFVKTEEEARQSMYQRAATRSEGTSRFGNEPDDEGEPEQAQDDASADDGDTSNARRKGNPYAEARVQRRENKVLRERLEKMIDLFERSAQENQQEQVQDITKMPELKVDDIEVPDYEEDPQGHLKAKQDIILRILDHNQKVQEKKEQLSALGNAFRAADRAVADFVQKPDVGQYNYNEATRHLAASRVEQELIRNPGLHPDEAVKRVREAVLRDKLNWIARGKNPGEMFYREAISVGFRPTDMEKETAAVRQPPARQQTQAPQRQSGRENIQRANERENKTRSLSNMNGAPAKRKLDINTLAKMDDREWDNAMDEMAKSMGKKRGELKISDFVKTQRGA